MDLQPYVQEFSTHVNRKNGDGLASLLAYRHQEHSQSDRLLNTYVSSKVHSKEQIDRQISSPWNEMAIYHLNVCVHIRQFAFISAYNEQANLVQCFSKAIKSMTNENWMLSVLNVLIRDLRQLAIAADLEASIRKNDKHVHKPHVHLEKAAELIMGLFRVIATNLRGSPETSKRKSLINVINQLFKVYFKINKLNLCKHLVTALESAKIPPEQFDLAERVTYNYFLGMKHMFDSDYQKADELLSFSFRNCHPNSTKNRRLILTYLIPVKMLKGIMPSVKLLKQFDLMQFHEAAGAIKQGNLRRLHEALESNSEFFWRYGTFLILEKLKIIAYRNLVKLVWRITGRKHQIPIAQLQKALNWQGQETSMEDDDDLSSSVTTEEVHCILANLIADGRIKGYISLQHQMLVISKQNPFPKLTTT